MTARLTLRRETLAELRPEDLGRVHGAAVRLTGLTFDAVCTKVGDIERAVTNLGRFPTETCTPPPR